MSITNSSYSPFWLFTLVRATGGRLLFGTGAPFWLLAVFAGAWAATGSMTAARGPTTSRS